MGTEESTEDQDGYEILVDSGAHTHVAPKMMVKNCEASGQPAEKLRSITGKQIQTWDKKTLTGEVFDEHTAIPARM